MSLVVVRSKNVQFDRGYAGWFISQITEVTFKGIRAYVRENRRASSIEHFLLSSGARLGHKADGDRIGREVLELAAPAPVWSVIAQEVKRLDGLKRDVLRHPQWNIQTAEALFSKKKS